MKMNDCVCNGYFHSSTVGSIPNRSVFFVSLFLLCLEAFFLFSQQSVDLGDEAQQFLRILLVRG
jgi:hypothetical protein